jgi:DNA-directed RNA polymerase subunit RPC12/RpoP
MTTSHTPADVQEKTVTGKESDSRHSDETPDKDAGQALHQQQHMTNARGKMGTYDTAGGSPISPNNEPDGDPTPFEEKVLVALERLEETKALPAPVPRTCCGDRLLPCKKCGADVWKSAGDHDNGDWEEETFDCQHCGNRIYVELPD